MNDDTLSFDIIREAVTGAGHYLGNEQTLGLMQSEYLYPRIADRTTLSEWEYRGAPDILETARREVKRIMGSHYPQGIAPERDASIRARFPIRISEEQMRAGNDRWPAV